MTDDAENALSRARKSLANAKGTEINRRVADEILRIASERGCLSIASQDLLKDRASDETQDCLKKYPFSATGWANRFLHTEGLHLGKEEPQTWRLQTYPKVTKAKRCAVAENLSNLLDVKLHDRHVTDIVRLAFEEGLKEHAGLRLDENTPCINGEPVWLHVQEGPVLRCTLGGHQIGNSPLRPRLTSVGVGCEELSLLGTANAIRIESQITGKIADNILTKVLEHVQGKVAATDRAREAALVDAARSSHLSLLFDEIQHLAANHKDPQILDRFNFGIVGPSTCRFAFTAHTMRSLIGAVRKDRRDPCTPLERVCHLVESRWPSPKTVVGKSSVSGKVLHGNLESVEYSKLLMPQTVSELIYFGQLDFVAASLSGLVGLANGRFLTISGPRIDGITGFLEELQRYFIFNPDRLNRLVPTINRYEREVA